MLQVNEIFGPTIQGEGPAMGRHCLFVRLFCCNLECGWCDTPYTWAITEKKALAHESGKMYNLKENRKVMSTLEIMQKLTMLWNLWSQPTTIVISGGEPFMQQDGLVELLKELGAYNCPKHIETAGTIMPHTTVLDLLDNIVVSPKLANSGNRETKRYKPEVLKVFNNSTNATFKFVLRSPEDFEEVDKIVSDVKIHRNRIMIMPEGTTHEKIVAGMKTLMPYTLERGYGMSSRLHTAVWENERGR